MDMLRAVLHPNMQKKDYNLGNLPVDVAVGGEGVDLASGDG